MSWEEVEEEEEEKGEEKGEEVLTSETVGELVDGKLTFAPTATESIILDV